MNRYVILPAVHNHRRAGDIADRVGCNWLQFADRTIVWGESLAWPRLKAAVHASDLPTSRSLEGRISGSLHLVGQVGRTFQAAHPHCRVILDKGRYLVVDLLPDESAQFRSHKHECWTVQPASESRVIVERVRRTERAALPWIKALVDLVSTSSYQTCLAHLAAFHTRHSLSIEFRTAANWAADELRALGYQVELSPVPLAASTTQNVVAERAGLAGGPRDLVLVTAHLDSVNTQGGPQASAPGADDNASGVAAVLEIGRVLQNHANRHDLRLILFGGEEQGLYGSTRYVSEMNDEDRSRVRAVINMDMIATLNTPSPTVLLEGAAVSSQLMDSLAEAAATYTGLTVERSLNPFASDHVPFINHNMPAVLTIEGTDSANANVHTANDTLTHIHYGLATDIVRMNVAGVATQLDWVTDSTAAEPSANGPAVAWGANRLDVFVVGTNSALYHKWWNGSAWGPSVTGYENMGGQIISDPEVVSWGANRLDVFGIGTNSALYHKWWNGSAWGPSVTGYEHMGGRILGQPKAVAWGPNRLDVFVIGTNSALYHKWWNGSAWGPSVTGYEHMGGRIISDPEVVSWGPNRLDVFGVGTNSALYHKWWNGSAWGPSVTGYENMGGRILGQPKVVSWGANRLDVFVIGTNSALYHKWWNGSAWGPSVTGYEHMGGRIIGEPEVVSWGPNRLDVFVVGTDSALYHKWWDGSAWHPSVTGWEHMGGRILGKPHVVSWGPNRLDVFVIGTNSRLYHKWWNGSSWGPSLTGYEDMGGTIIRF